MIEKNKHDILCQVFKPVSKCNRGVRLPLLIISVVFLLTAVSVANSARKTDGSGKNSSNEESHGIAVDVSNFGKVTDFLYRGAQPKGEEYDQLATLGIKTVIDLRNDPKDYAKNLARRAGLKYINFPMSDKDYPASDTASKFLELVNDHENWPVFIHCAGGRHRTGAMAAVFRMTTQGWDVNRAYEEMKVYDFYTRWGHKAMKQYVFDYYRDLLNNGSNVATSRPRQVIQSGQ